MANISRALVLVFDDDVTICSLAHAYLRLEGYRVETAANGEEALAILREHVPCAMVVDLRMPGMDGAELRRRQLASAAVAEVPFILMSASPALCDICERRIESRYRTCPEMHESLHGGVRVSEAKGQ